MARWLTKTGRATWSGSTRQPRDTASVIFQTGYSRRVRLLHLKDNHAGFPFEDTAQAAEVRRLKETDLHFSLQDAIDEVPDRPSYVPAVRQVRSPTPPKRHGHARAFEACNSG